MAFIVHICRHTIRQQSRIVSGPIEVVNLPWLSSYIYREWQPYKLFWVEPTNEWPLLCQILYGSVEIPHNEGIQGDRLGR